MRVIAFVGDTNLRSKYPIFCLKGKVKGKQSLCERLRNHKVFTKDQCFYLNYHKFSIKSYVLDVF